MSEEQEFFAEAIIGWRCWHIRPLPSGYRLLSLNYTKWEPYQWLDARCPSGRHEAPGKKCGCGIYCVDSFEHLQKIRVLNGNDFAFGEVWIAGEIVEGTNGWRAARAYPKQLYLPHTQWRHVGPLKSAYGIPVKLRNPYEGKEWRKGGYRKREA